MAMNYDQLFVEHPEALHMDAGEVLHRFWMYDPVSVAQARMVVVIRRMVSPVLVWLDRRLR